MSRDVAGGVYFNRNERFGVVSQYHTTPACDYRSSQ